MPKAQTRPAAVPWHLLSAGARRPTRLKLKARPGISTDGRWPLADSLRLGPLAGQGLGLRWPWRLPRCLLQVVQLELRATVTVTPRRRQIIPLIPQAPVRHGAPVAPVRHGAARRARGPGRLVMVPDSRCTGNDSPVNLHCRRRAGPGAGVAAAGRRRPGRADEGAKRAGIPFAPCLYHAPGLALPQQRWPARVRTVTDRRGLCRAQCGRPRRPPGSRRQIP